MRTPLVAVVVTALRVTGAGATSEAVGHSVKRIGLSGTDTQDDVRIDYLDAQAGTRVSKCNDGSPTGRFRSCRPSAASRSRPLAGDAITPRMVDRSRDISAVLDALPGWFGTRADIATVTIDFHQPIGPNEALGTGAYSKTLTFTLSTTRP